MKKVRMSLVSRSGQIVNTWEVPYARRRDALHHAMERAEQEGSAGVLWAVEREGVIREFAFDSHDPLAITWFGNVILPFMTPKGLAIDRLLHRRRVEGVSTSAAGRCANFTRR